MGLKRRQQLALGYGVALLATLLVALARLAGEPVLAGDAPFLPFVFAVMAAAWYGGLWPGLAATVFSAFAGLFLFVPPLYSLHIEGAGHVLQALVFVAVGITVSAVIQALHGSRHSLEGERKRLEAENEDRRRAEMRLRENEQRMQAAVEQSVRYAAVVESSHEAIIGLDLEGLVETWNAAAVRIFGYTAEEMTGADSAITVPADLLDEYAEWMYRVRAGQTVAGAETVRLRKDGARVDVLLNLAPIFSSGRVTGVSATVEDITERKRAEARIHQLVCDLQEADRRKDEFLAMLAHELRNPLAPISSALEIMDRSTSADSSSEWPRSVIRRQLAQLTRIVDDLLQVSRLTQGKIRLEKQRIALDDAVESAIETSRPLFERHGQRLIVTLPPERLYADADPVRLAQAISNLLSNASKYSDDGSIIEVSARRAGNEGLIAIRDQGKGVPADLLPHVFDLFTQGDQSLARLQGGLGVGLTVVRQIAELHGGSVSAESAGAGRGSTFTMRLPLAGDSPLAATTPKRRARTALPPCKVLVVDDNVDSAEAMKALLEAMGHRACSAYDGESGLQAAAAFEPDLVLLDIGLPGMDGYETIGRLRAQCAARQPVVAALTGYGRDEDRERALAAGFDHHLMKPVNLDVLLDLMASLNAADVDADPGPA